MDDEVEEDAGVRRAVQVAHLGVTPLSILEQIASQPDCGTKTGSPLVRRSPLLVNWTLPVAVDAHSGVSGRCYNPSHNRCCMSAVADEALALAFVSSSVELVADLEHTYRSVQVMVSDNQDALDALDRRMAADSLASVVVAVRDELEVDVVAHGLDFSNLLPSDDEVAAVLLVLRSWSTSGCLWQRPGAEAASAAGLYQDEQVVEMVACFACS